MVAVGEMPVILSAPGTVEARATVNVRPRVDGQIAEVLFREGDLVKAGQVLFRLDDRLVRAQIAQAEAQIKRDEAQLADAEGVYERRSALVQKRIVSESAMDTARANMEALKAAIAAGKANLDAQKTQLDYLTITAPITGRTGATTFKPGANVRAADTQALVVINQTQPVNVVFALPQTDLVALRRALDAKASAAIRIPVPNQPPVVRQGSLDFIDNQVDRTTGPLTAKVSSPNEDELLWPGLAVEVAVTVERIQNIASVPVSAVLPSQLGMICWVIGADNKVQPRPVVVARIVGQIAYIQDGLKGGERVVVDGQGRIAPGMTVQVTDPTSTGPAKGGKGGKGGETQADAPRG
jgi:multidrug efflux system membrane fusion protein